MNLLSFDISVYSVINIRRNVNLSRRGWICSLQTSKSQPALLGSQICVKDGQEMASGKEQNGQGECSIDIAVKRTQPRLEHYKDNKTRHGVVDIAI